MSDERRGYVYGLIAYALWGFFPIYFKLLKPSPPFEILAHRILWSVLFISLVLAALRNWGFLRRLRRDRRLLGAITLAGLLIGVNWATYIVGVNSSRVVETALGYFIGPLVSVLLGVLMLGERLRPPQWTAVGLCVVAIVVLVVGYGQVPWIALLLACSFATYGLVKKLAGTAAVESMAVETVVMLLPALAYVVFLEANGTGTFVSLGVGHTLLLVGGGLVTTVPLLAFAAAAVRIPLATIGLLQYITPTMQFTFGVLVFREQMPPERWLGFAIVWLALALLTFDGLRRNRRPDRLVAGPLSH